jgi:hypothetical protein
VAKKKRAKRHRQPVAPPVHSAPAGVHHTGPAQASQAPPARPMGAEPPGAESGSPAGRVETPRRPRQTPAQRKSLAKRKSRRRSYVIAAVVVALIVGLIAVQRMNSGRANASFNRLASAAGCSGVKSTGGSGSGEHLHQGEKTTYDTSPPTHGEHALSPLPKGAYDKRFSDDPNEDVNIYRAVHSLEHGAIIIWYDKLKDAQLDDLKKHYRDERKVLIAPYPQLKGDTHVAVTAWGRLSECERASTRYIDAFVKRFREARSAPEPNALI